MENLTLEDIVKARDFDQEFIKANSEKGKKLDLGFFHSKSVKNLIFPIMGDLSSHFAQESVFENVIFLDTVFSGANFNRSKFNNCIFSNCKFVKCEMQAVQLTGCTFNSCNLFRVLFSGDIGQCIFQNCQLEKMILSDSHISNSVFSGETAPDASNNTEHNVIWNIRP